MEWDWIIAVTLILGLVLAIWARMSHQTMGEVLLDIKSFFTGIREDSAERIVIYD